MVDTDPELPLRMKAVETAVMSLTESKLCTRLLSHVAFGTGIVAAFLVVVIGTYVLYSCGEPHPVMACPQRECKKDDNAHGS